MVLDKCLRASSADIGRAESLWEQAAGEQRHGVMKTQAGRRILKEDLQLESTGCFTVKKRET